MFAKDDLKIKRNQNKVLRCVRKLVERRHNSEQAPIFAASVLAEYSKSKIDLSSLKELDNSPLRCDLHPRLSHDGEYVSIDTLNRGYRQSYLYKILD